LGLILVSALVFGPVPVLVLASTGGGQSLTVHQPRNLPPMNSTTRRLHHRQPAATFASSASVRHRTPLARLGRGLVDGVCAANQTLARLPSDPIAALGRFSIAALFWLSGQTKVEGFALNLVQGRFEFGWPRLSDSARWLFREEYQLPLLDPVVAALLATSAEHALPILLLLGLGTRFAALGLLIMTAVIQLLVYPNAYATHGVWAAVLLWLMAQGPGRWSLDHLLARWFAAKRGEPA